MCFKQPNFVHHLLFYRMKFDCVFRSFESLVEELVKNGIIVDYPKFFLSEFIGDHNIVGSLQELDGDSEKDPVPCLGDVRRVVNEFCILPMGIRHLHYSIFYITKDLV